MERWRRVPRRKPSATIATAWSYVMAVFLALAAFHAGRVGLRYAQGHPLEYLCKIEASGQAEFGAVIEQDA
jgi:hypothetical protein